MTFSPLISGTIPHHGKYDSRQGREPEYMIDHHWAGTTGGDTSLASPERDASVHYIIYSDGRIVGQVPEEYRAWTSGTWEADSRAITVEMQNSTAAPEWRVSDQAIAALIALTADIAQRYGWGSVPRHRVRGHRDFYATACPGPYLYPRLGEIADAAQQALTTTTTPLRGDTDMIGIMVKDIDGRYGAKGGTYYALSTLENFVQIDQGDADAISVHLDRRFASVTYATWERLKKVAEAGGIAS